MGFEGEERGVFEAQRSFIQASGIGVAMLGLLQAIPGTQLWRRLEKEGRLLSDAPLSVIPTAEGLNFVPKGEMTKREYLERYRRLVKQVFAPEAYFVRILPALLALRGIPHSTISRLMRRHFPIFFRMIYHLGVRARGSRILYWKTFLRVLWSNPTALEAFGHDCYYFYHLSRHADFIDRELSKHLASPDPDDVLDVALQDSEMRIPVASLRIARVVSSAAAAQGSAA